MNMKRFIIISVLAIIVAEASGCLPPDTHNYYLFSAYQRRDWKQEVNQKTLDNWKVYTDGAVQYWFDADKITEIARQKGDLLMVGYVDNLQKYLEGASSMQESWHYPTKEEVAARKRTFEAVRTYAQARLKSRLRSQYALLYMRCNMVLNRHNENIAFWEQTAIRFPETVYKEMMQNIYAGALLKSGRKGEAVGIFADMGDVESLYTYFYEKRSLEGIQTEYRRNANSPALPFLLQDFANNAQEAADAQNEMNWPGKLFIRDIKESESRQMCQWAEQVLTERNTQDPALWKSLVAWLEWLRGEKKKALVDAEEACTLDGSPRSLDNARVIRLFIHADVSPADASLDRFLATELNWLEQKANEERGAGKDFQNHYTEVYDRLVHQVLTGKYEQAGRHHMAAAFLAVYDEQPKVFWQMENKEQQEDDVNEWNGDYSSNYFEYIDTMKVDRLETYWAYTQGKGMKTELDKWISARIRHDDVFMHELLGTKYLRLGMWKKAIAHLEKVPLDFINRMNIASYMAKRSYTKERWMGRQEMRISSDDVVTVSQKLEFAQEMLRLEKGFSALKNGKRQQRAYELATRYYQAGYQGDAWYLTRYGQSCIDTLRVNEMDFYAKTRELLNIARQTDDMTLKEKVLYAMAFSPTTEWYEMVWDDQLYDWKKQVRTDSWQYQWLENLADFYRKNEGLVSSYVSHCDVLKQFLKE